MSGGTAQLTKAFRSVCLCILLMVGISWDFEDIGGIGVVVDCDQWGGTGS